MYIVSAISHVDPCPLSVPVLTPAGKHTNFFTCSVSTAVCVRNPERNNLQQSLNSSVFFSWGVLSPRHFLSSDEMPHLAFINDWLSFLFWLTFTLFSLNLQKLNLIFYSADIAELYTHSLLLAFYLSRSSTEYRKSTSLSDVSSVVYLWTKLVSFRTFIILPESRNRACGKIALMVPVESKYWYVTVAIVFCFVRVCIVKQICTIHFHCIGMEKDISKPLTQGAVIHLHGFSHLPCQWYPAIIILRCITGSLAYILRCQVAS